MQTNSTRPSPCANVPNHTLNDGGSAYSSNSADAAALALDLLVEEAARLVTAAAPDTLLRLIGATLAAAADRRGLSSSPPTAKLSSMCVAYSIHGTVARTS